MGCELAVRIVDKVRRRLLRGVGARTGAAAVRRAPGSARRAGRQPVRPGPARRAPPRSGECRAAASTLARQPRPRRRPARPWVGLRHGDEDGPGDLVRAPPRRVHLDGRDLPVQRGARVEQCLERGRGFTPASSGRAVDIPVRRTPSASPTLRSTTTMPAQPLAGGRGEHRTAAEREHAVRGAEGLGDDLTFQRPEGVLAVLGEHVGDRLTRPLHDQRVDVGERRAEPAGEEHGRPSSCRLRAARPGPGRDATADRVRDSRRSRVEDTGTATDRYLARPVSRAQP